jgi:hypothetical protein
MHYTTVVRTFIAVWKGKIGATIIVDPLFPLPFSKAG